MQFEINLNFNFSFISFNVMSYLVLYSDGPDDHVLGLLLVHVVEAQGVYLGSQVASHLVGPESFISQLGETRVIESRLSPNKRSIPRRD